MIETIIYECKGCGKVLTGSCAHLIDVCVECVEKKQPGGKFATFTYHPLSYIPKTKSEVSVQQSR